MTEITIDLSKINNWDSFHDQFAEALGFPDFYGRNLNAWVDCMSDLSSPETVGMTRIQVPKGEDLILVLPGSEDFASRCPEVCSGLLNATAQVNQRKMPSPGERRVLLLLM